jgi:hypothetical protein
MSAIKSKIENPHVVFRDYNTTNTLDLRRELEKLSNSSNEKMVDNRQTNTKTEGQRNQSSGPPPPLPEKPSEVKLRLPEQALS